jgi:shikimate dehydrogenase
MNADFRAFGLIGFPLSHSFSRQYFTEKFDREGIPNCSYDLFPLKELRELPSLFDQHPHLVGLNVTIPYKEKVIDYLDALDDAAAEIGAVNTVLIRNGYKKGFNTDAFGFEQSLRKFLGTTKPEELEALILGTGGAAKAVAYVLKKLGIRYQLVSRTGGANRMTYQQLLEQGLQNRRLIINTTPLGMSPNFDTYPDLPYADLDSNCYIYDLVYNPEKTMLLQKGEVAGARIKNGLEMLYLQAEKAWSIWNTPHL